MGCALLYRCVCLQCKNKCVCCCLIYGAGVGDRTVGVSSALKLSMVGAVTTAAGREFQEWIARVKNQYLKQSFFGE